MWYKCEVIWLQLLLSTRFIIISKQINPMSTLLFYKICCQEIMFSLVTMKPRKANWGLHHRQKADTSPAYPQNSKGLQWSWSLRNHFVLLCVTKVLQCWSVDMFFDVKNNICRTDRLIIHLEVKYVKSSKRYPHESNCR